jgi:hypothetical protein
MAMLLPMPGERQTIKRQFLVSRAFPREAIQKMAPGIKAPPRAGSALPPTIFRVVVAAAVTVTTLLSL